MIKLNGKIITPTMFPDGTSQVWKLDPEMFTARRMLITWEFEHEGELMHVAQLKHLLDNYSMFVELDMPYLPYARQDKEVGNNATFALRTFASIINHLGFDRVTCFDPHSRVASEVLACFHPRTPEMEFQNAYFEVKANLVVYPDKGAKEKYGPTGGLLHIGATKIRDQLTGHITHYELSPHITPEMKTVLIVDDICDGGATFVHLCKALQERGIFDIHLFVSHGIFSKGTQVLRDAGIKRIFTRKGEVK